MDRYERMKNELLWANMNRNKKRTPKHLPIIITVNTIVTAVIIFSWSMFVIR